MMEVDTKMNQRIQELMEQATSRPHRVQGFRGQPTYIYPGILDPAKFAELIVLECARIDFYKLAGIGTEDDAEVTRVIKEHFGIAE
jgi:hypothetical protein